MMVAQSSIDVTKSKTINIVMIDSSQAFLESLPLALHRFEILKVTARASSMEQGIALIQEFSPDVTLVDGRIYQHGFRDLSSQLSIRLGECRVVVFANSMTDAQLEIAAQNHVCGFLSGQDSTAEIAESILRSASGEISISESLHDRLNLAGDKVEVARRSDLGSLSNRQLEVLTHLAHGLRVKEIAELMQLSNKAVESHKFRIMSRLQIRDRVKLCRWAIREGLIDP